MRKRNMQYLYEPNNCCVQALLEPNKKYMVEARVANGKKYYSIVIKKHDVFSDRMRYFSIPVYFRENVDLKNGQKIVIQYGWENVRENPNDEYRHIYYYFVSAFTLVDERTKEERRNDAIERYRKKMEGKE